MSEHIPTNLSIQTILQIGEVDLAIEVMIRELDDSIEFEEEIDRTIVIHLLRMCYLQGWQDMAALLTS